MKTTLTIKNLIFSFAFFLIGYIVEKILDDLIKSENINEMIKIIVENLFPIIVFSTIIALLSIKLREYYKIRKEKKQYEIFKNKTLMKYMLYKNSNLGIFMPTQSGSIPKDLHNFFNSFSEDEIKIINDEKLIAWKIEFLL